VLLTELVNLLISLIAGYGSGRVLTAGDLKMARRTKKTKISLESRRRGRKGRE